LTRPSFTRSFALYPPPVVMLPSSLYALAFTLSGALVQAGIPSGPAPPPNNPPDDTSNPLLEGKRFPYTDLPEQADTSTSARGTQTGYNRCNSTTQGPDSQCQTLIINSLQDFCFWAPPVPNSTIGGTEEEEVAWCTLPTHGGRLIPPGTITGAQFIKTESYLEITALLNQENVNLLGDDAGGELDSGGQDNRGNPIGGLVYSTNLPSSSGNGSYLQSPVWSFFIGSGVLCGKACDPNAPNAQGICQHVFDVEGCNTNVPAAYQNGTFLSCLGDDQAPVEPGLSAIPASSDCTTFQSTDLWPLPTTSTSASASATAPVGTASGSSPSASSSTGGATRSGVVGAMGMIGLAFLAGLVGFAVVM